MPSNPQIISDLKVIMEASQKIELLLVYKGVPFVCKASVMNIDENYVWVKTQASALVCMEAGTQTRVLGSDYFEPAVAQVMNIDVPGGTIELANFSYVGIKLGERMIVRVEPRKPIDVHMDNAGVETIGALADISLNGIGVRIKPEQYSSALRPGANLQIKMQLPVGALNLSGAVISVIKTADCHRLAVRFTQNDPQRSMIFHYLIDRRTEIEQEVHDMYQAVLSAGGTSVQ